MGNFKIGEKSRFHPNNQGALKHTPLKADDNGFADKGLDGIIRGLNCCLVTSILLILLVVAIYLILSKGYGY